MYKPGDLVVYGIHGVCRFVQEEGIRMDGKISRFLILEPLDRDGDRCMIPADNPQAMSKLTAVLSAAELKELVASAGTTPAN